MPCSVCVGGGAQYPHQAFVLHMIFVDTVLLLGYGHVCMAFFEIFEKLTGRQLVRRIWSILLILLSL